MNRGVVLRSSVLSRSQGLADLRRAGRLLQRLGDQLPGLFTHHRRLENRFWLNENLEENEAFKEATLKTDEEKDWAIYRFIPKTGVYFRYVMKF